MDLQKRVQSLQRIVERWEIRGGTPQHEFESDALAYITDDPGYQAIEWVDNTFHVRWVVPQAGNDKAHDLYLGFEQKRPTLSSPVDLVQGGKGFLVYDPIFVGDEFKGFLLAVFRTQ